MYIKTRVLLIYSKSINFSAHLFKIPYLFKIHPPSIQNPHGSVMGVHWKSTMPLFAFRVCKETEPTITANTTASLSQHRRHCATGKSRITADRPLSDMSHVDTQHYYTKFPLFFVPYYHARRYP